VIATVMIAVALALAGRPDHVDDGANRGGGDDDGDDDAACAEIYTTRYADSHRFSLF